MDEEDHRYDKMAALLDSEAARQKSKSKSNGGGRRKTGADSDPSTHIPPGRHAVLEVRPGCLPELADEAERILIECDSNIFQRVGTLARLAKTKAETVHGIRRPASATAIVPVDPDFLVDRLNRNIAWRKYSDRKSALVTCNAPHTVASTILARAGFWKFRHLVGVVTAPTLRPDGSILDRPGYDDATGLLFAESQSFPAIPKRPDRERARRALDFLMGEVLSGFNFAAPHDRAAALSAILTATVRHSLRTAPLHAFSAPRPGSGKSLLADCVGMIATGRPATVMSFTGDPEEQRKRILTVLLGGDSVINLDNIESALSGDALCLALTAETFTDRVLGTQRQATAPTCATWLSTGNNLTVAGDMTRRVVLCNLDPGCERPEERSFARNLYEWLPANRPLLVTAALTALRGFIVAGRPPQALRPFGGFECWSNLVRSALVWLGESDPLANRARVEDNDPIRWRLKALLVAWFATFRTAEATSKELVNRANEINRDENGEKRAHPELYEVLSEHFTNRRGEISAQLVGEFIKKNQRRIECGIRFEEFGNYGTRRLWKVEIIDESSINAELPKFLDLVEKGVKGARVQNPEDSAEDESPSLALELAESAGLDMGAMLRGNLTESDWAKLASAAVVVGERHPEDKESLASIISRIDAAYAERAP